MLRILLILMAVCSALISTAGKRNFNKGQAASSHYYSTIPLENIKNKLIVPVMIKGKEYKFLLDTGGPCAVSQEIKSLLAPKKPKKIRIKRKKEYSKKIELVTIDSIEVGGVLFTQIPSLVRDFSSFPFTCLDIDGLLGSNLLRNSILHINLEESQCTLTDSIKGIDLQGAQKYNLGLTPKSSSPLIMVEFYGKNQRHTEQVLFDSGVDKIMTLSNESFYAMQGKCIKTIATDTGYAIHQWAGRYSPIAHLALIPYMRFADFRIIDVLANTAQEERSIMGTQILENGNLTLDYIHKKLYYSTDDTVSLIEPILPYSTVVDTNGLLRVGYVWNEVLKNKLSSGDQILSIDSHEVNKEWICKKLTTIEPNNNSTTQLKVKRRSGVETYLEVAKAKPYQVITEFVFPPIDN